MINDNETPAQKDAREQLQRITALLAGMVKQHLDGAECGFALVLFDFGEKGSIAYASDGMRGDVTKALRELVEKMEMEKLSIAHLQVKPPKG